MMLSRRTMLLTPIAPLMMSAARSAAATGQMTRAAAHPNFKLLFDCYHFWSGQSKFEDLDRLEPGDVGHVHFQDVPDMPRELLDQTTRVIPGDGVTPLVKILRKL